MATTVTLRNRMEFQGSDTSTWELEYNIEGTDDPIEARLQLIYQTGAIYDGLVRKSCRAEYQGLNFWIGSVTYGNSTPTAGRLEYQFDVGGETYKCYQSLATSRYPSTAPDYGGAIGIKKTSDGIEADGVEIDAPSLSFSLIWTLDAAQYTTTLQQNIYAMKYAPVNSAPFLGFAAGELLFKGASGGVKEGDETGNLTLKFMASPNVSGLTVGTVSGISKYGWQYMEVVREEADATGSGTKFITPKIVGVYVHTVYSTSNFSALLGI